MQNKKTWPFTFYLSFSMLGYFLFCYLQVHMVSILANLCLYVAGFCTIQGLDMIFEFKNKLKYMLIGLAFVFWFHLYAHMTMACEALLEIFLNGAVLVAFVGLVIALIVKGKKKEYWRQRNHRLSSKLKTQNRTIWLIKSCDLHIIKLK